MDSGTEGLASVQKKEKIFSKETMRKDEATLKERRQQRSPSLSDSCPGRACFPHRKEGKLWAYALPIPPSWIQDLSTGNKITITTSHKIRAHSTGHLATRLGIMNRHEGHLRDLSFRLLF